MRRRGLDVHRLGDDVHVAYLVGPLFNVFAPGAQPGRDTALFIGETGGKRFEGKLTTPGDYTVQVYMMRSAARRNETAEYTLKVGIGGLPTLR